jgi:predicted anti-sigma-YlaC factor YlaD
MNILKFEQNNCTRIRAFLDSYLNNELLVETTHEVLRHLETCSDCGDELKRRQHLKSLLKKAVMQVAIPASLETRIKKGIRRKTHDSWARWALAIAATLAVVLLTSVTRLDILL